MYIDNGKITCARSEKPEETIARSEFEASEIMSWITETLPHDIADYLFNVRVTLDNRKSEFVHDVRDDVMLDYEDLEEQLQETPQMLLTYDLLLADQNAKVAALERRVIALRGNITSRFVKEDANLRRSDIEDIIESDKNIDDIEKILIVERRNEQRIRAVIKALQMKSEHLRSLAGFKREDKRHSQ